MAGALIALAPTIVSGVAALLPEVPKIIQAVEGWFGDGQGPTKRETAVDMTTAAANRLATAGKIDGIPDATTITTLVETIVQQMNAQGLLGKPAQSPAATPATPPAAAVPQVKTLNLPPGQYLLTIGAS